MPDPTPPADPNTPPATPPADQSWFGGDPEVQGYLQNRGLHDKPVNEVALAAIRAHREAEKFVGVPANQLLRLPTDAADADGWRAVWTRLGAPADANEYDFSGVQRAGDQPLDARLTDALRTAAATAHLPKDAAIQVAKAVAAALDQTDQAGLADKQAKLIAQKEALAANWGANFQGNMLVAQNAAKALGISPEAVAALEGQVGYDKVMEMFREIGSRIGEDRYVSNAPNNGTLPTIVTREQAVDQKRTLMQDEQFAKRFLNGDAEAVRQMQALDYIIAGAAA